MFFERYVELFNFDNIKQQCGIALDDTTFDGIIGYNLDRFITLIFEYLKVEELPPLSWYTVVDMVVDYMKISIPSLTEERVSSVRIGDTNVTFDNKSNSLRARTSTDVFMSHKFKLDNYRKFHVT